jgi:PTS system fructose-specific IIA component/PTS system nitrogen regulatory IIA component
MEPSRLIESLPFVASDGLVPNVARQSKPDVLRTLVHHLVATGRISAELEEGLVCALIKRETLASTGIGQGVAIPHTKHPEIGELIGVVGWCPDGLEFDSLDDEPVYLVVLLLAPANRPTEHLQALALVSSAVTEQLAAGELCGRQGNANPVA